jgi:Ca2+/H+ antiporter, TMEM165/GDT1 family
MMRAPRTAPELPVNLEKVIFGFFIILACTLNFGFFIGDLERAELHHPMELFFAVVVNLIATVLKFGDRTQLGATHLATSLVASLQLLAASIVWVWQLYVVGLPMSGELTAVVVSLSGGALLANLFSVVLLIGETLRQGR